MTAKPLVSVIIVNYNAGKLLGEAVRSVVNFPGVEVVVADNASKDGSFAELQVKNKSKNVILIDNGANLGFGKAVNQAVKQSHGEYVYLLNPDASLKKSALMRMIETAHRFHDRCIVAPRLENPDGSAQPSCYPPQTIVNAIREYWLEIPGAYGKFLPKGKVPVSVNAAVAAAWLVPRTVWDELGGLSDRFFLYFEDLDMCDRARARGIPVIYDPGAVVSHAHGVSSRTNPVVLKLFTDSAWTYHGTLKKICIDLIIRARDLVTPPVSAKKFAVLLAVASIWMVAVAALGYFLLPEVYQPLPFLSSLYKSNFLVWSWANFDGEHYLRIASDGYSTVKGQSEFAFFPLYPLLIKAVATTGLDIYLAAHMVTFAAAAGALYAVTVWARRYLANPLLPAVLLLVAPGAVFLGALYTEPLFILLAALTFICADRKEWGRAALCAALASATRVNGIFLGLFLLVYMLQSGKSVRKSLSVFVASLTGIFAYMGYLAASVGDPLAWFHAQSGWAKSDPTYPWVTFSRYIEAVTTGWQFDLVHVTVIVEIVITVCALYFAYKYVRDPKKELAYKLYIAGNLALPLATGSLGSMPRFALTLFPLFVLFPGLSRRGKLVYLGTSLVMSIMGIIFFTRGYWFA